MTTKTTEPSTTRQVTSSRQRDFCARLVIELARKPGNLFVSPYSVWALLAMLHPGARGESRDLLEQVPGIDDNTTGAGMERLLELTSTEPKTRQLKTLVLQEPESFPDSFFVKKKEFDLIVANALWLQEGYRLQPAYVDAVRNRFKARIEELDLAGHPGSACDAINAWANENTRGRISEVLSPDEIRPLTRLILSNATYFKDLWVFPFEHEDTVEKPFHRPGALKVRVQMMHQTTQLQYFQSRGLQAVRLPYLHSGLSMTVLLPKKIRKFEAGLTPEDVNRLLGGPFQPERVHLGLPRVRNRDEHQLVPILESLGLGRLFDTHADLSGISSEPGVYVDEIKQVSFVEIDEEGTEAAAVTAAYIAASAPMREPPPKIMIVDRPYWFFIRDDKAGLMLFAGRVEDPS